MTFNLFQNWVTVQWKS